MASGYVGPALARSLATRGYDLVLQGTDGDDTMVGVEVPFTDQVPALEALGARVHTVTDVDLATAEGNRALISSALDRFGRIDSACLVTGLIVALVVSVLQAVTQVQEQTLSFVPKIVAMLLVATAVAPWITTKLLEFARQMFGTLP